MSRLAAPRASTVITAANRIINCSEVIYTRQRFAAYRLDWTN